MVRIFSCPNLCLSTEDCRLGNGYSFSSCVSDDSSSALSASRLCCIPGCAYNNRAVVNDIFHVTVHSMVPRTVHGHMAKHRPMPSVLASGRGRRILIGGRGQVQVKADRLTAGFALGCTDTGNDPSSRLGHCVLGGGFGLVLLGRGSRIPGEG